MVTHWNRSPAPWTTPLIVLTALLAVAAIVVHVLGQGNPSLNATGGLRNILFVATSFLVLSLGRSTLEFLIQYTSKRFDWTLAEVRQSDKYCLKRLVLD